MDGSSLEEYNGFLVDGSVTIAHPNCAKWQSVEPPTRPKHEVRWCRSFVSKVRALTVKKQLSGTVSISPKSGSMNKVRSKTIVQL